MLVDATTAIEDRSLLGERRLRPRRHRRRGHRRPARPAPRRLDDHPAARPPAAPDDETASAVTEVTASRKLKEIIQSIRVTQAYPGRGRQAADHGRLPQPELLRQRVVRRRGGRAGLLRQVDAHGPDPRPGGDHRRAPPVAVDLRPRRATPSSECVDPAEPTRRRARRRSSSSPRTPRIVQRRNQVLDRCSAAGGTPLTRDEFTDADFEAAKAEPVVVAAQRSQPVEAPRSSCGRSARSSPTRLCGERGRDVPAASRPAASTITSTLDMRLQGIAEKWVKAATIVPHAKNPAAAAARARARATSRGWRTCATRRCATAR